MAELDNLKALAASCELLGRLWVHELTQEQIAQLRDPQLADQLVALGCDLSELENETAQEDLAIDYCQLLIGPADAVSPFQSVHDEGRFHGEAFASCQKFHQLVQGGVPVQCAENPDHFAAQLLFLATVMDLSGDESGQAAEAGEVMQAFFDQHVRWTDQILVGLSGKAKSRFYQSLARVTRSFVIGFSVT